MSAPSPALALLTEAVGNLSSAEQRPSQVEMATAITDAVRDRKPLIVQAGTGTGKSLAYLCAAVGAEVSVVISTATRQLSDQLVVDDVPRVQQAAATLFGWDVSAAVLKGRANYLCLAKLDDHERLERSALEHAPADDQLDLGIVVDPVVVEAPRRPTSADLVALNELLEWARGEPNSADRSDGPAVPDSVWQQLSTPAAACPSARKCAFGAECYAERAREAAREADIVVTNHALLAADMDSPAPLFDDRELVVIDEVHELSGYLSNAWGAEVHAGTLERVVLGARRSLSNEAQVQEIIDKAVADYQAVMAGLMEVPDQRWLGELPAYLNGPLDSLSRNLSRVAKQLDDRAKSSTDEASGSTVLQILRTQIGDSLEAIDMVRRVDDDVVRWSAHERDSEYAVLRASPLEVGAKFRSRIGDRCLVATSATASVAGDFTPTARTLGLAGSEWTGLDVGSPFDYRQQGILYLPRDIPEPVGKDRREHTAAVLDELTLLVDAAGGRTLALFTTSAAARNAAAHLRTHTSFTILEHGELPAADLAEEFTKDESSVLCATMGMWAGLNVVGDSCMLVVIDKVPFAPMDDPLAASRRELVDQRGGDGFGEIFVNDAALLLTQGAGRLIRSRSDRGVVAILDPRLNTRRYGRVMLDSLPSFWRTDRRDVAVGALRRLSGAPEVG